MGLCLLTALPSAPADLIDRVEDAYSFRQLRRTPFEPRAVLDLDSEESRFLESLFILTDAATLLNVNVGRWFLSTGREGLHAADYPDRINELRLRLANIETPSRLRSVRDLIAESLELQRNFVRDWYEALESGRPFASQLTDEYAYHEGLHRSHRVLLKAYAELRALFPFVGKADQMAFQDHLRAMDWK